MRTYILAAVLLFTLPSALAGQPVRRLDLVARQIVYDRVSQRLYASVEAPAAYADCVAVIEPVAGAVEQYIRVGTTPGRLALSDDGQYLYVALNGEPTVRRVVLSSRTVEDFTDLGLTSSNDGYHAVDLAVLPGSPESIAVVLADPAISGAQNVAVYDRGRRRASVVLPDVSRIAFGSSASVLYGTDDLNPSSFYEMAVDGTGLALVASIDDLAWAGNALVYAGGLLYTGPGRVVDPNRRAHVGLFPPISFDSRYTMALAPEGDRAYLVDDWNKKVRVYDARNFVYLWSFTIPSVGTYFSASLVSYARDRLALQTESQVMLIDLTGVQPLTVSKSGNGDGTVRSTPYGLDCGEECSLLWPQDSQVTLTASPGPNARFVGWAGDPDCADGVVTMSAARSCTAVFTSLTSGRGVQISLAVTDLAYSVVTGKLYAAVPGTDPARGNTITEIDPDTGALGRSVFVGSQPDKLRLADDGVTLYAAIGENSSLRRVDLTTMTAGPAIDLGLIEFAHTSFHAEALDYTVLPGNSGTVAVSRDLAGVGLYQQGVLAPTVANPFYSPSRLVASASGSRLYGQFYGDIARYDVLADGVTFLDEVRDALGDQSPMMMHGGRLYFASGLVFDPEALAVVGRFTLPDRYAQALVVPDDAKGVVSFVIQSHDQVTIDRYDSSTFQRIDSTVVPGAAGPRGYRTEPTVSAWTGAGRLAFARKNRQVFLFDFSAPVSHTLSISSTDTVTISTTPADADGAVAGTPFFTRRYPAGMQVTVTAPPTAGEKVFRSWQRQDGTYSASPTLTWTAAASEAITARYGYPRPTMTSVTPAVGLLSGGTAITIKGTNFREPVFLYVGSNPAYSVTVVDSTTITARTPYRGYADTVALLFYSSEGDSVTLPAAFTYVAATVDALVPSPAVPAPVGSAITWRAMARGGVAPLQYQFWLLEPASGWRVLRDWNVLPEVTWTPQAAGQYALQVWVRSDGSTARWEDWRGSDLFTITPPPPLRVLSLDTDTTFPTAPGRAIQLTASVVGGVAPLQYRFWLFDYNTGSWSILRDYAESNATTWTPSTAGKYALQVWVRNAGSGAALDAWLGKDGVLVESPRAVMDALVPSPTLPATAGTTITWAASAHGGAAPLEYRFWLLDLATGAWSMLRDWSTVPQATWTPAVPGTYAVQAWVRSAGATVAYDSWLGSGTVAVTGAPAVEVLGIDTQPALPAAAGTPISVTARATGGSGSLEYAFWIFSATTGTWTQARAYAADPTMVWTPSTAGTYALQVWVRRPGSTAAYDAWLGSNLLAITLPTVGIASLQANQAFPLTAGLPVTWNVVTTGGGALEYQFWLWNGAAWSVAQAYGPSTTFTWTPPAAGTYAVQTWVRRSGSAAAYEAWATSGLFPVR